MPRLFKSRFAAELKSFLKKYSNDACNFLEWGTGECTPVVANFAHENCARIFLSIDNNSKPAERLSGGLTATIPRYPFLEFQNFEWEYLEREDIKRKSSYISYPREMGYRFDCILINGQRKFECQIEALSLLNPNGRVVLRKSLLSRNAIARENYEIEEDGNNFIVLRPKVKFVEAAPQSQVGKRVIFAILQGQRAIDEHIVTGPFLDAYAKRIGADLKIIEAAADVPKSALKTLVLDYVDGYDRFAILDIDIIVRPHAPDLFSIVPPDHLGVMIEGRRIDRTDNIANLIRIYGRERSLPKDRYFNSGVIVMGREHIPLIEALRDGPVFGSPYYEQGLLNILAFERKVPVFDLPLSLNYVLDPSICQDWRRGTLIHVAGGGKKTFKLSRVWQEENYKNSRYLSEIDFRPPFVRVPRLMEIAAQIAGKEVHIFDADDFHYASPFSYPLLRHSNLYISLGAKPDGNLAVFGPYASMRAGRWRVRVLAPDKTTLVDPRVSIDFCSNNGKNILSTPVFLEGQDIWVEIPAEISDFEARLNITNGRTDILAVMLEWDGDGRTSESNAAFDDLEKLESDFKLLIGERAPHHGLPQQLIVSITSIPSRFSMLPLTLRTLIHQSIRPDRIIVWIDYGNTGKLPIDMVELEKQGIEIREIRQLGPISKFIHARKAFPEAIVVTADDDQFYWMTWLDELVRAWSGSNKEIICHRAHKILTGKNGRPLPYLEWEYQTLERSATPYLFPTGCAGVLYSPRCFSDAVFNHSLSSALCPSGDDVWLYWMAQRNEAEVINLASIAKGRRREVCWPKSQENCLAIRNMLDGGNDKMISDMTEFFGWPPGNI